MGARENLEYLLKTAEEEYYYVDEIINVIMETDVGLDYEDLPKLIEHRDKLYDKIIYCRELLGIVEPINDNKAKQL